MCRDATTLPDNLIFATPAVLEGRMENRLTVFTAVTQVDSRLKRDGEIVKWSFKHEVAYKVKLTGSGFKIGSSRVYFVH